MVSYVFALVTLFILCNVIAVAILRGGKFPEEERRDHGR